MLALDPSFQGREFCIRQESMEKFKALDVDNLEVCDMSSRPLRLVLNHQMIKIMEDMWVARQWFLGLQERELDGLREATSTAHNRAAFLSTQEIGRNLGYPN
jgi:hypothetical protein